MLSPKISHQFLNLSQSKPQISCHIFLSKRILPTVRIIQEETKQGPPLGLFWWGLTKSKLWWGSHSIPVWHGLLQNSNGPGAWYKQLCRKHGFKTSALFCKRKGMQIHTSLWRLHECDKLDKQNSELSKSFSSLFDRRCASVGGQFWCFFLSSCIHAYKGTEWHNK